ncbi:MAG: sensor histidine kinase, partial [Phascolarctobacterium sp.]|nr:sensor histidine kinase [Phascolarctobacterium sp.]
LTRLLIILLDNAIKYSEPNTEINFSLTAQKNNVLIKIADQGIGIKPEDKEQIFERFYRVDKARSRSMGGLGLGLSLAKAIVNQHNGKIWIEDNKPQGSIFNVQLPKHS